MSTTFRFENNNFWHSIKKTRKRNRFLFNNIHVWILDLDSSDAQRIVERAVDELPFHELTQCLARRLGARASLIGKVFLRRCLSSYLGIPPKDLIISVGAGGKPSVSGLQFNLSHSNNFVVLALTTSGVLGVDIERICYKIDWHGIARRHFHEDEFTFLLGTPHVRQVKNFFQFWTLKEAALKATGHGLVGGLSKARFSLKANQITSEICTSISKSGHWQFSLFEIKNDYILSIALITEEQRSPVACTFYRAFFEPCQDRIGKFQSKLNEDS